MKLLLRRIGTLASALMLMGCAALPPPLDPAPIPASLRQLCRVPAAPADASRATAKRWAVEMALALRECRDRHAELVNAVDMARHAH